ncbi:hypothetical protein GCM10010260_17260 [Streptomyces filipinensis]|uniref:Uncharacterized protein n=1 Tax=Streptomyces filipinensis TaxID=66887 RepID=A0A918I7W3_9ACTN|nr:hypothetical protein GCM10010260_17260 [Streptomyces filipinensis]
MTTVVSGEIGGLVTRADEFGVSVQQNRGLDFSRVHVGEQRGAHPRPFPRRLPVLGGREQRHPLTARGGLLDDVAQHVVAAVPVDHDQRVDARAAQRRRDVPDHRMKGHGGDADGPRPVRVLVRAGDRHRRKEVHRVRGGDLPRHGAGDERVGRQGKERPVLLEAPYGKDGDLC